MSLRARRGRRVTDGQVQAAIRVLRATDINLLGMSVTDALSDLLDARALVRMLKAAERRRTESNREGA